MKKLFYHRGEFSPLRRHSFRKAVVNAKQSKIYCWQHEGESTIKVLMQQLFFIRPLAASVLLLSLLLLSVNSFAGDHMRLYEIDIAQQDVAKALTRLSEQVDVQVFFPYNLTKGKTANAIKGNFTVLQALDLMLKGSGLHGGISKNGVLTISLGELKGDEILRGDKSMLKSKKNLLAATVAFFMGSGAAVVSAVDQNQVEELNQRGIDEIIVTAQKRDQRIQDIPISISAITGEKIENAGIQNIADLSYAVPNLSVWERGPGLQTITIRGVGNIRGTSSLVGMYLDEVPVSAVPAAQLDLQASDLARVEVLRGPQGTLYGQGSVGGTIRFITNNPTFDGINGEIGISVYNTKKGDISEEIKGVVNIPVIDDVLAFRISASYKDKSGWIDQPATGAEDINDNELSNLRVKGLWQVSDQLTVNAMTIRHRSDAGSDNVVNFGAVEDSSYRSAVDPTLTNNLIDDYDLNNLTVNYDLGFANLISASSFIDIEKLQGAYSQFALFGGATTETELLGRNFSYDVEVFTQEFRLSSYESETALDWTVGVFYSDSEQRLQQDFFRGGAGGIVFFTAPPRDELTLSESIAYFADISYDITDRLTLGIGTRYFEDDRELRIGTGESTETFDNLSSKAYLSFELSDNTNIYTSASEGFRSGGFNALSALVPSYDPETLTSYELGIKTVQLDKKLSAELAIFFSDYTDFQAAFFDPATGDQYTSNPGEAEIKGIEWNIQWVPTEQLSLGFSGNITDAEFTKVNSTPSTQMAGDPLDFVPEYSYSVNADYRFDWSDSVGGFVRFNYNRQGENSTVNRTSSLAQSVFESEPISLLNAQAGAQWQSMEVELFAKNILDEDESTTASISLQTPQERPRTIGIKVNYSF